MTSKEQNKHSATNSPPRKKPKEARAVMPNEVRESFGDFESSLFDASDGHKLVELIRKKKGVQLKTRRIFDDVPTSRPSLHVEILRLEDESEPAAIVEKDDQCPVQHPVSENIFKLPRRNSISRSITSPQHKLETRRISNIGRRTLLKEFEKTLQESRFLPPTCSTPLEQALHIKRSEETNLPEPSTSSAQDKNLDENIVCTPITITDEDSPENRNCENIMQNFIQQNGLLSAILNSEENRRRPSTTSDDRENNEPISPNRKRAHTPTTPTKEPRRTFTIHRDNVSGNLILSPSKAGREVEENDRQPLVIKTPDKSNPSFARNLVLTPEQRKLLLSRFGRRDSPQKAPYAPKLSQIPVSTDPTVHRRCPTNIDSTLVQRSKTIELPDTAQFVEDLRKNTTSNYPVIVIPVNQTFNQAPIDTTSTRDLDRQNSPISKQNLCNIQPSTESQDTNGMVTCRTIAPINSVLTERRSPSVSYNHQQFVRPITLPQNEKDIDDVRLEDIFTEDSSSSETIHQRTERQSKKSKKTKRISKNRLSRSISHSPRCESRRHSSSHSSSDLRVRNSLGQIQSRLISKVGQQLEELRHEVYDKNCEDECEVDVFVPPPEEFCDPRLNRLYTSQETDLIDEISSERVSLESKKQFPKKARGRPKKEKMPENVKQYLEANKKLSKNNLLSISKRKLYCKGQSDMESCDELHPSDKSKKPTEQNPKLLRKSQDSNRNLNSNKLRSATTSKQTKGTASVNSESDNEKDASISSYRHTKRTRSRLYKLSLPKTDKKRTTTADDKYLEHPTPKCSKLPSKPNENISRQTDSHQTIALDLEEEHGTHTYKSERHTKKNSNIDSRTKTNKSGNNLEKGSPRSDVKKQPKQSAAMENYSGYESYEEDIRPLYSKKLKNSNRLAKTDSSSEESLTSLASSIKLGANSNKQRDEQIQSKSNENNSGQGDNHQTIAVDLEEHGNTYKSERLHKKNPSIDSRRTKTLKSGNNLEKKPSRSGVKKQPKQSAATKSYSGYESYEEDIRPLCSKKLNSYKRLSKTASSSEESVTSLASNACSKKSGANSNKQRDEQIQPKSNENNSSKADKHQAIALDLEEEHETHTNKSERHRKTNNNIDSRRKKAPKSGNNLEKGSSRSGVKNQPKQSAAMENYSGYESYEEDIRQLCSKKLNNTKRLSKIASSSEESLTSLASNARSEKSVADSNKRRDEQIPSKSNENNSGQADNHQTIAVDLEEEHETHTNKSERHRKKNKNMDSRRTKAPKSGNNLEKSFPRSGIKKQPKQGAAMENYIPYENYEEDIPPLGSKLNNSKRLSKTASSSEESLTSRASNARSEKSGADSNKRRDEQIQTIGNKRDQGRKYFLIKKPVGRPRKKQNTASENAMSDNCIAECIPKEKLLTENIEAVGLRRSKREKKETTCAYSLPELYQYLVMGIAPKKPSYEEKLGENATKKRNLNSKKNTKKSKSKNTSAQKPISDLDNREIASISDEHRCQENQIDPNSSARKKKSKKKTTQKIRNEEIVSNSEENWFQENQMDSTLRLTESVGQSEIIPQPPKPTLIKSTELCESGFRDLSDTSVENTQQFLSRNSKSKKNLPRFDSGSSEYPSSSSYCISPLQQKRLTIIAENQEVRHEPQSTIPIAESTSSLRLSQSLMPPPASTVVAKKKKTYKTKKQEAFRKLHDKSIADVSAAHLNNLFDQMKNSSMNISSKSSESRLQTTRTGQVSRANCNLPPLPIKNNCKNLSVRLQRLKVHNINNTEKVSDSGFLSEAMVDSAKKNKQKDILMDWLVQILNTGKNPIKGQMGGLASILEPNSCTYGDGDELQFQEHCGIDYAFYKTSKQNQKIGYLRFKPHARKDPAVARMFEMSFVLLCGTIEITVNKKSMIMKNGDMVTVFLGASYSLKNHSNDPALVMMIKSVYI